MGSITSTGMLVGAGLMYFFDPALGARRRARVGQLLDHARHTEQTLIGKAIRDGSNRARGVVERLSRRREDSVPDEILDGRVRAQLGRGVAHPGALEVGVRAGCVVLRGPILEHEAAQLVRRIKRIPGVREVTDGLDRHVTADNIPGLQGGAPHPPRTSWPPAARGSALIGGAALMVWGLATKRSLVGPAAIVSGGLLALRGTLNMPVARIIGVASDQTGVTIYKTIDVDAPIERVFELWSRFEDFPRFMQHVRAIRMHDHDRRYSQWTVDGPAGAPLRFEAELVRFQPHREIAWRTLQNQALHHAGVVHFESTLDGTRVHIEMTYRPPGGVLGHTLAHALGWDPKARIDDDLIRMKALLEDGRTRAHGERIALSDLH